MEIPSRSGSLVIPKRSPPLSSFWKTNVLGRFVYRIVTSARTRGTIESIDRDFSRVYYRRWTRGEIFFYPFAQRYIFPFRCAQMRFLCTHSGVFRFAGVGFNGFVRIVARFYGTIWTFKYVESTSEKKTVFSDIFFWRCCRFFGIPVYGSSPVSVKRTHNRYNTVYILSEWYIRWLNTGGGFAFSIFLPICLVWIIPSRNTRRCKETPYLNHYCPEAKLRYINFAISVEFEASISKCNIYRLFILSRFSPLILDIRFFTQFFSILLHF